MLVKDLMSRADSLADDRAGFEAIWDEIARLCLPSAERASGRQLFSKLDRRLSPRSTRNAPTLYNSKSVTLISRLAAGMEGLTMPQGEKWHHLKVDDPFGFEPTVIDQQWLDKTRDYMFSARYDPRSGFHTAMQNALRRKCSFGTAVVQTEEAFTTPLRSAVAVPVLYSHIPLAQCFLAINAQGVHDTNFRRYRQTARQLVQKHGIDKVSAKVRSCFEDPKRTDDMFEVLHAVMPREEAGSSKSSNRDSAFASYYVEWDTQHLIGDGGFFEFPYHVICWSLSDDSAYGDSPVMEAIADIRRLQNTAKHTLRATQQSTDPPLAVGADGSIRRPNLNPRALNYGALDEQGNFRVRPLITATRPDFALEIQNAMEEGLRESLYINLFQAMLDRSANSATEAMIRADEKAQLLGPAGSRTHNALAGMIEREAAVYARKGAFEPESRLAPPPSLQGREVKTRFTSPLDRMRRSNEVLGIQQTLEMGAAIAELKQDRRVLDRIDGEKALMITREVVGAPASILRSDDEMIELDEQRKNDAQMMAAAQAMELVQGAARSTDAAAEAAGKVGQVANENPEAAEALGALMQGAGGQ